MKEIALELYYDGNLQEEANGIDPFKFMMEHMTLYYCNSCSRIYNGGKNDEDGALRENMNPENFLCRQCSERALGYGQEFCQLHGNEFTDFKC